MMRMNRFSRTTNRFANKVYRVLHPEFKVYDTGGTGTITAFTSSTLLGASLFPAIVQGNTAATRQGNRILSKGIYFKFLVEINPDDFSNIIEHFRIVVILDRTNEGSTVSLDGNDIFITPGTNTATEMAFQNTVTTPYWQILWDSGFQAIYNLSASAAVVTHPAYYYKSLYITTPFVVTYGGNAGTVSDINGNMLWVLMYTSSIVGTQMPTYFYTVRIRYLDC